VLPFERITYFVGLAVALLAWGGTQMVERVVSTPTILFDVGSAELKPGSAATAEAVATIRNLSRTHAHKKVVVLALAPDTGTGILRKEVRFSGVEPAWQGRDPPVFSPPDENGDPTSAHRPETATSAQFTIDRFDPGASFEFKVPYVGTERPKFRVLSTTESLRIIGPSIESFVIGHQFEWLASLIGVASLCILVAILTSFAGSRTAGARAGGPASTRAATEPPAVVNRDLAARTEGGRFVKKRPRRFRVHLRPQVEPRRLLVLFAAAVLSLVSSPARAEGVSLRVVDFDHRERRVPSEIVVMRADGSSQSFVYDNSEDPSVIPVECRPGDRLQARPDSLQYYHSRPVNCRTPIDIAVQSVSVYGSIVRAAEVAEAESPSRAALLYNEAYARSLLARARDANAESASRATARTYQTKALTAAAEALNVADGVTFDQQQERFVASEELVANLRSFQRRSNIEVTGKLDSRTLQALSGSSVGNVIAGSRM
jgi:hypothetical protein